MWEPRRLTTLWASTACYRDSLALPYQCLYLATGGPIAAAGRSPCSYLRFSWMWKLKLCTLAGRYRGFEEACCILLHSKSRKMQKSVVLAVVVIYIYTHIKCTASIINILELSTFLVSRFRFREWTVCLTWIIPFSMAIFPCLMEWRWWGLACFDVLHYLLQRMSLNKL
jgi:hypothetical protein